MNISEEYFIDIVNLWYKILKDVLMSFNEMMYVFILVGLNY